MLAETLTVQSLALYHQQGHHKHYLCQDAHFTVSKGGTCCIAGPSGCGKSTLLRVLAGLHTGWDGEITLDGTPLDQFWKVYTTPAIFSQKPPPIQLVFQNPLGSLHPYWRVYELLLSIVQQCGLPKERIMEVMDEVQLQSSHLYKLPRELSGGQRQRVVIASCLLANPHILLLDEATSALDAWVQKGILDLLKAIQKKRGLTIILVSHDHDVMRYMGGDIVQFEQFKVRCNIA